MEEIASAKNKFASSRNRRKSIMKGVGVVLTDKSKEGGKGRVEQGLEPGLGSVGLIIGKPLESFLSKGLTFPKHP